MYHMHQYAVESTSISHSCTHGMHTHTHTQTIHPFAAELQEHHWGEEMQAIQAGST